ncbi:MAG: AAA family ATPase [Phycisphaerales bacterium]
MAALKAHGHKPRESGDGWSCTCPAHDDTNPSLSIKAGDDGRALVHCHAGCPTDGVCHAIGLRAADLFASNTDRPTGRSTPKRRQESTTKAGTFPTADDAVRALERQHGRRSAIWTYTDAGGESVGLVVRWNTTTGKDVRPVSRSDDGRWRIGGMAAPRPLYALPDLLAAPASDRVWVCEGEKAADAAQAVGLTATTSPHGSKSASKADWCPMAGRDVVILPDHDDAGEGYADDVVRLVTATGAKSVRVVRLVDLWAGMPEGGDLADLLDHRGGDGETVRAEVEALANAAQPVADSIQPLRVRGDRNELRFVSVADIGPSEPTDWLWPGYIARGSVTLLTGRWKGGKTTLLSHLLRDLYRGEGLVDTPIDGPALIVSEEPLSLWRHRRDALPLPADVRIAQRESFAKPSRQQWEAWIETLAETIRREGVALVVFDTLAGLWPVDNENDAAQVQEALALLRDLTQAGAAVLLCHHPRKGEGDNFQASRGSGALPGFADILVELQTYQRDDASDRRRKLVATGRYEGTPAELVIELGEAGYIMLGEPTGVRAAEVADTIAELLPAHGEGMTADDVATAWPTEWKPGKTQLRGALKAGHEAGRWVQSGKGVKGSPYTYTRPPDSIQSPETHSG